MIEKISDSKEYQRILEDLAWLDRNVRLDPQEFATDWLFPIAQRLTQLVEDVSEGVI